MPVRAKPRLLVLAPRTLFESFFDGPRQRRLGRSFQWSRRRERTLTSGLVRALAEVEALVTTWDSPRLDEDLVVAADQERVRAVQVHLEILSLAGAVQDLSAADQNQLSFYLAGSLPLDLDFKQKLLAMRSEGERLGAVAAYLEGILPKLRRVA